MKRFLLQNFLLILFVTFAYNVHSSSEADTKYWILFKDKGEFTPDMIIKPGSEAYQTGKELLTDRAIQRRLKVLTDETLIDFQDLPLYEGYVSKIESLGIEIIARSRWFNGVSAYLTPEQFELMNTLDFVERFKVVEYIEKQSIEFIPFAAKESYNDILFSEYPTDDKPQYKLDYGHSLKQMEVVNVPVLHNMDITGKGVLIANFDDGFDWRNHEALRNLSVLDEYDFINKDANTFPEKDQKYEDLPSQGGHGTSTLSAHSGYMPGKLIAPAFDSDIILAKTEYIKTETPMEEDFWLEAAEWAEALGADIITSSLIYKEYDEPYSRNSYTYEDFNGDIAITSLAAKRSAYLGIVVLNAMGNYFQTATPSLGSAADADSIIAVGAIMMNGNIAMFSSNGPTSDGRIKPEVVAPGVSVYVAVMRRTNDAAYSYSSGTSFSTPITAGICALILSAHPHLTPMQVREAVMNTASNSSSPNNIYGWGIVNAFDAILYHGMVWSNEALFTSAGSQTEVSTYLASRNLIDTKSVKFHYSTDGGNSFKQEEMKLSGEKIDDNNSGKYSTFIDVLPSNGLIYYFTAKDMNGITSVYPKNAPDSFFQIN